MKIEKSFLGTGWSFPPTFDKNLGDVKMVSDEKDIKESLQIYLNTRRGERLMRLNYGSTIHDHVFDSSRNDNLNFLSERLKNDIRTFEPRIIVNAVNIDTSDVKDGIVRFGIQYEIQSTNIRDNIVYPFYLVEGTHIPQ